MSNLINKLASIHEIVRYNKMKKKKEEEQKKFNEELNINIEKSEDALKDGLVYLNQKDVDLKLHKLYSSQYDQIKDILTAIDQINDMEIKQKIEEGNHKINKIAENTNSSEVNMDKANDKQRKSAQDAIARRGLKYKFIFGTLFGVLGSVVPVYGNVAGAVLGAKLGQLIQKAEEKDFKEKEQQ